MTDSLNQLIAILQLEQLDSGLFQGSSIDIGTNRIYGGQVLGQALAAMQMTVDNDRTIHSMHAYFMRAGDHRIPITYQVEISRDGKSFSTRHVRASQQDKLIFIANASFQVIEAGLEFQLSMPDVTGPETVNSLEDYIIQENINLSASLHSLPKLSAPFIIKPVSILNSNDSPQLMLWLKTSHPLIGNIYLHRSILAYISDYGLLTSTLIPHGLNLHSPRLQLASIDHGIWFHRPFRVDQWLLYVCEPVSTNNARGIARGSIFNSSGQLICTTMQEGLLRQIKKGNK